MKLNGSVHRLLWAKSESFQPLWIHMIAVGATVQAILGIPSMTGIRRRLADALGTEEKQAVQLAGLLAALHDMGKAFPDFQMKNPDATIAQWLAAEAGEGNPLIRSTFCPGYRHEYMSADWLFKKLSFEGWGKRASGTMAAAIQGHHGTFDRGPAGQPQLSGFDLGFWEEQQQALWLDMTAAFGPWPKEEPPIPDHSTAGVILAGLIILADWIASSDELMPRFAGHDPLAAQDEAGAFANEALRRLGFASSLTWSATDFCDFWSFAGISGRRPIQRLAERVADDITVRPGLAIIEAPMGEGKTEAGVYLGARWSGRTGGGGLFVALPTMATSNQMYSRVRALVDRHNSGLGVQLVHGMAWILDVSSISPPRDCEDVDRVAMQSWFQPRKRSLLAPYGVGTVDQAMMAALTVRHGVLRLFGLAGKALIIDEVHAYDIYMSTIIDQLLDWCGHLGIPVVLLSATLPSARRRQLVLAYQGRRRPESDADAVSSAQYPLLTVVSRGGEIREYSPASPPTEGSEEAVAQSASHSRDLAIEMHEGLLGDIPATADMVCRLAAGGGCIGAVMNTVKKAQELFRELRRLRNEGVIDRQTEILLYHSRFPAGRRQEIESAVLERLDKKSLDEPGRRPCRFILVATQVVEQSLDIDFDVMVSEIAPIDLLLQRAGRLWRHLMRKWRPSAVAVLHVLAPAGDSLEFGGTGAVYHPYYLIKTWDLLKKMPQVAIPADLRFCVEAVYDRTAGCTDGQFQTALPAAEKAMRTSADQEEQKAAGFILPRPATKGFVLANKSLREEQESEAAAFSYLRPSTRLGDDSRRVLILSADEAKVIDSDKPVFRNEIRQLMLKMVSVPGWWLAGVEPAPGGRSLEGPRWLRDAGVLVMEDGRWRGVDRNGNARIIQYSSAEGLTLQSEEVS